MTGKTIAALIAIFAVFAASDGSALAAEFTATKYPASVTGKAVGSQVLIVGNEAAVECTEAAPTGTLSGSSGTLKLTPSYGGCHVSVDGVKFSVTASAAHCVVELNEPSGSPFKGDLSIANSGGECALTFNIPAVGCSITVPGGQSGLGAMQYANSRGEIEAVAGIGSVKTTNTCGLTATTATLKGKMRLGGADSGETDRIAVGPVPPVQFVAKEYPAKVVLSGHTQVFGSGGFEVTCKSITLKSTLSGPASVLSGAPEYEGCDTDVGGVQEPITVSAGQCDYALHTSETASEGTLGIVPETGVEKCAVILHWEAFACTISWPGGQTGLRRISYANAVGGEIDAEFSISGIEQTNTCGLANGTFGWVGAATMTATGPHGENDAIEVEP